MDKNREYTKYIEEHKRNIVIAWRRIQGWLCFDESILCDIGENIKNHDASKSSNEEFYAYRNYFFTKEGEDKNKEAFNKAWLHHIHSNFHHWEYYVIPVKNIAIEMPLIYVVEMLLDWQAMSYKFGDSILDFYEKNRNEMVFHEKTTKIIEELIQLIDEKC